PAKVGKSPSQSSRPSEMDEARRWAAAKFEDKAGTRTLEAGLLVLAQHDPRPFKKDKNPLSGKPLKLGDREYAHGLFCHAPSKVVVYLPGPGKTFSSVAGVDSNEETAGGQGSVVFSVSVGGKVVFHSDVRREGMPGVPVQVDLNGATQFTLEVGDSGDGHIKDQAAWFDTKAVLADGRELWLGDFPTLAGPMREPYDTAPPFSFVYNGQSSASLLKSWPLKRERLELDPQRTQYTLTHTDPQSGLEVRWVGIEYHDYPTVEWTWYFKNTGSADSQVLSDIEGLDMGLTRGGKGEFVLHHNKGTFVRADDYEPLTTVMGPNQKLRFAPPGGRPLGAVFPYYNIAWSGEGVIVVIGWPGQWAARFERDEGNGLRVIAGQELTHLKLQPGEEIRTPLMVLQFWKGDWERAQNVWRSWMLAHNVPRPGGKLPGPLLTPCSSHQFGEMIHANEQNQIFFIDRYLEEGLKIDYWWMDAGWYVNKTGWPNTGTWEVDPERFPHGLRAITDHAHSKGVKCIVWFEPERVTPGTWLYENHPEWLLRGTLFNLGNPAAREWLTDHIDHLLTEQGIDLYRQDYNIDPLGFWRGNDAPDRQGITENHYVTGYLAYWDELRRRHPNMLIDSCASGGHRNDLETMRRAVPFLRSDYIQNAVGNQCHTYGLSLWLPYHGTGSDQTGAYEIQSDMACPSFIACWDMRNRNLDYDLFRRLVGEWRQFANDYFGDYYPLTPYSLDNDVWMAWQFDRPDLGEGMVQAFRRADSFYESVRFKLHNLKPGAYYRITNLDSTETKTMSGRELMDEGLYIALPAKPSGVVFQYRCTAP
ncbi:MAG: alpha-galactosidase, partial [Candidatus Omnitrophica bacterium]|nr:alpha-galactosidase [Candidatus Omnitrophota bacterium]